MTRRKTLFQIFRAPLAIFLITSAGLIAALIVSGAADIIAATAVAASIFAIAFAVFGRR